MMLDWVQTVESGPASWSLAQLAKFIIAVDPPRTSAQDPAKSLSVGLHKCSSGGPFPMNAKAVFSWLSITPRGHYSAWVGSRREMNEPIRTDETTLATARADFAYWEKLVEQASGVRDRRLGLLRRKVRQPLQCLPCLSWLPCLS